jgi:hypothetical protein
MPKPYKLVMGSIIQHVIGILLLFFARGLPDVTITSPSIDLSNLFLASAHSILLTATLDPMPIFSLILDPSLQTTFQRHTYQEQGGIYTRGKTHT